MGIRRRQVLWRLTASLTALALVPACGADAGTSDKVSTSPASSPTAAAAGTTTTAIAAPLTTQGPGSEKWIDLEVGECLAALPSTDLNVVTETVTIVDCATAHQAEVYFRAPVAVDAAITEVANHECDVGFSQYTGQSIAGSPFVVTYLIDSRQDRTSNNPEPSTVICLLHAADGRPLTASARR